MLDTLKLAKRLEAANMDKVQAEALALGLNESLKESYVSREYLDSRLQRLKADMLMANFIIVFAVVGIADSALFWALSNLIHSLR